MLVVRTFIIASYKIVSIKMLQKWQIDQNLQKASWADAIHASV